VSKLKVFLFILLLFKITPSISRQTMKEEILDFWFDYQHHSQPLYDRDVWWQKNEAFDAEIRKRFLKIREEAVQGKLNQWRETPKGTLAYVILLDQFSRNAFRNTAEMYQYDHLALAAAKEALHKEFDQLLSFTERVFLYMPFEHSENKEDQEKSVALFMALHEQVPEEAKALAAQYLSYAKDHYDIVARFHRFPHRNKLLGRVTTPEEAAFLEMHSGY